MDMLHSIWNLSDPRDIDHKQDRQISAADQRIWDLQFRVGNLAATCQALCNLMVEKLGVSPEEIKSAIEQVQGPDAP